MRVLEIVFQQMLAGGEASGVIHIVAKLGLEE